MTSKMSCHLVAMKFIKLTEEPAGEAKFCRVGRKKKINASSSFTKAQVMNLFAGKKKSLWKAKFIISMYKYH